MFGFTGLPPEVISNQLYTGAGAAPLQAAAAAWDHLATQWHTAANTYRTIITELTDGPWQGPAATAMTTAAHQHLTWMHAIAQNAEQTATQAHATATAYQQAHATVVPPTTITANRTTLHTLITTNTLGQNTALIANNQAEYAEMAARNTTAMHTYATTTTTTTTLPPPPQTTPNHHQPDQPDHSGTGRSQPAAAVPGQPAAAGG